MSKLFEVTVPTYASEQYDLTSHITVPTYVVNRMPVYTSWTDAQHIEHRQILRYKISGTFTVLFSNKDEQDYFLTVMKLLGHGAVPAKVWVVNTQMVHDANVFIEFTPAETMPLVGNSDHDGFAITITER